MISKISVIIKNLSFIFANEDVLVNIENLLKEV
jgi:hypothetical protein